MVAMVGMVMDMDIATPHPITMLLHRFMLPRLFMLHRCTTIRLRLITHRGTTHTAGTTRATVTTVPLVSDSGIEIDRGRAEKLFDVGGGVYAASGRARRSA